MVLRKDRYKKKITLTKNLNDTLIIFFFDPCHIHSNKTDYKDNALNHTLIETQINESFIAKPPKNLRNR